MSVDKTQTHIVQSYRHKQYKDKEVKLILVGEEKDLASNKRESLVARTYAAVMSEFAQYASENHGFRCIYG